MALAEPVVAGAYDVSATEYFWQTASTDRFSPVSTRYRCCRCCCCAGGLRGLKAVSVESNENRGRRAAVATFVIYDRRYSLASLLSPPSVAHADPRRRERERESAPAFSPSPGPPPGFPFPFNPLNTFASSRSNFGFPRKTRGVAKAAREMRSGRADVILLLLATTTRE